MRGRQVGSSAINDRHMAVYGSRPDPGPGGATKLQGWSFAFSFGDQFAEKPGELQFGFGFAFGSHTASQGNVQRTLIRVRFGFFLKKRKKPRRGESMVKLLDARLDAVMDLIFLQLRLQLRRRRTLYLQRGFQLSEGASAKWIFDVEIEKK